MGEGPENLVDYKHTRKAQYLKRVLRKLKRKESTKDRRTTVHTKQHILYWNYVGAGFLDTMSAFWINLTGLTLQIRTYFKCQGEWVLI